MIHVVKPIFPPTRFDQYDYYEVNGLIYSIWKEDNEGKPRKFISRVMFQDGFPIHAKGEDCFIICLCGSDEFKVVRSSDYETSARCCNCGHIEVVHDG